MSTQPADSSSRKPQRTAKSDTYYVRNQAVVVPAGHLAVGQIVGAHGLYGELKVEAYTDYPERFAAGAGLLLGEDLQPVTVESMRPHKSNLLVRLAEIEDRTAAEELRGLWLYVPEADAAALEEGAYWIHDIVGLRVVTTEGQSIGNITDVFPTGANDVYVVQPAPGVNGGRDLLLPAIADVVERVDLAAGVMVIHLMEGLIDPPKPSESSS
jgi:16S rRNA processing protein RimM